MSLPSIDILSFGLIICGDVNKPVLILFLEKEFAR